MDNDGHFQGTIRKLLRDRNGAVFMVGALAFPMFVFVDLLLSHSQWREPFGVRLACSLVCLLLAAVNKTSVGRHRPFLVALTGAAVISVLKALLNPLQPEGPTQLYFLGHVLIVAAILGYLPLSFWQALVIGLTAQVCYVVPTILSELGPAPLVLLVQNWYLASLVLILSVACLLASRMRRREFELLTRLYEGRSYLKSYRPLILSTTRRSSRPIRL